MGVSGEIKHDLVLSINALVLHTSCTYKDVWATLVNLGFYQAQWQSTSLAHEARVGSPIL